MNIFIHQEKSGSNKKTNLIKWNTYTNETKSTSVNTSVN